MKQVGKIAHNSSLKTKEVKYAEWKNCSLCNVVCMLFYW